MKISARIKMCLLLAKSHVGSFEIAFFILNNDTSSPEASCLQIDASILT